MDVVIPRSRDEQQTIVGTLKWQNKISPERIDSPIAA